MLNFCFLIFILDMPRTPPSVACQYCGAVFRAGNHNHEARTQAQAQQETPQTNDASAERRETGTLSTEGCHHVHSQQQPSGKFYCEIYSKKSEKSYI